MPVNIPSFCQLQKKRNFSLLFSIFAQNIDCGNIFQGPTIYIEAKLRNRYTLYTKVLVYKNGTYYDVPNIHGNYILLIFVNAFLHEI